jgi:hypothetical protein
LGLARLGDGVLGSRFAVHDCETMIANGRSSQAQNRGGSCSPARAGRSCSTPTSERRVLQFTRGALPEFAGSLRRHLYRQAQALAAWVESIGPVPVSVMALTVLVCYYIYADDPNPDAVHLMPVCGTCWSKLVAHGQADVQPDTPYWPYCE